MGVWSPGPGGTAGNDTFTGDGTNETANGLLGDDTLIGNGGHDTLIGHGGSDNLSGGDGDDSLNGGTSGVSNPAPGVVDGADVIDGGAGNDVLRGQDGDDTLTGGDGVDNLRGDLGNDTLNGGNGEDLVSFRFDDIGLATGVVFSAAGYTNGGTFSDGRGGMDTLISIERIILTGTTFADQLTGDVGRDQLSTQGGNDIINAGAGNDTIFDYNGSSILNGQDGNDRITIEGTDVVFSGFIGGEDYIDGGAGNDTVYLSWSYSTVGVTATLSGTTLDARTLDNSIVATGINIENIEVDGSSAADVLIAGAGNDGLWGFEGDDILDGGDGNDLLWGGDGSDVLNGGAGIDRYVGNDYATGSFTVHNVDFSSFDVSGDPIVVGDDSLTGIDGVYYFGQYLDDTLVGSAGADWLIGSYGTDNISGGAGDDFISGTVGNALVFAFNPNLGMQVAVVDGNDTYAGGDGADTLSFLGTQYDLTINASTGVATSLGTGTDSFSGFEYYVGGTTNDEFIGSAAGETFDGDLGDDVASGDAGNDVLIGGAGNDSLDGGDNDDTLTGGAGFDELSGGAGNDVINVGEYEFDFGDSIDGGDGVDELIAFGDAALDTHSINSIEELTFANDANYNFVTMSGSQIGSGFSSTLAVTGTAAADEIDIFLGAGESVDISGWTFSTWDPLVRQVGDPTKDVIFIVASTGNETIVGSDVGDHVYAGSGNDNVSGGDGSDFLRGEAGDDTLNGGSGDDVMRGGAGVDTYVGGDGLDRISFYELAATQGVVASLLTQTITNDGFGNAESISGIEDFGGGTAFADSFEGNNGANLFLVDYGDTVTAQGGDDTFQVDRAAATINGGDGNDTILSFTLSSLQQDTNGNGLAEVISGSTGVIVDLGAGQIINDGFGSSGSIISIENAGGSVLNDSITGSSVANILNGFEGDDALFGLGGADTLNGDVGNDTLDGGAGADTMTGGDGDDVYVVDNAGDVVTETSALGGVDTVQTSVTRTLGAHFENLVLTGAGAITGYGNALNNSITGNGAANFLYGYDGADILNGGAGADQMFGGNGNDTYYVDNAGDVTSEVSALGGVDIVFSSVNRNLTANIENLTLTGSAGLTGSGNALNNVITGNTGANTLYGYDGNDRLDGGAGADTMFGANGDDTYVVDDVNDITVEGSPTGGIDTVESSINRNLNANFENLILTGTAQFGYGNLLNNVITGNAASNGLYGQDGNDTLDGGAGADQMFGANGDDTYIVDNAGDVTSEVSAGGGIDTVISSVTRNLTANLENLTLSGTDNITGAGNALNNVIIGNSGANTLYGLDGADTLNGGLGADTLQGGTGADSYVFSTALGGGNVDSIVGFSVVDDTIVLSNAIFTGLSVGTLAASAFVIGAAAADADDRIIYNSATGALFFDADGNGGGAAVQFATLATGLALTNNDFIVSGP